jgi:hypothetical protein
MKKKIWLGLLWGLSCDAQEREPDFFNEQITVVGVEENVVLQEKHSLEENSYKTSNDKEEKRILVDGEKEASSAHPVTQPPSQNVRSAWGGKGGVTNREAIGWSVPATFMRMAVPQGIGPRPLPTPVFQVLDIF